ncbi:hypothetical protein [Granulicella arctica]|uniref:hypothetical protein n=1 Tax=Granulicella arctica TaxID=940613 RepID=UPI0021E0C75B|nr:hypothetical protein [Granulicella arctica]
MKAEVTQAEFEAQWQPIPLEDFPLPACPQGMILLKAFADAHPDSFEFIRPEDFVHYENDAFAGIEEWDAFAQHCLSCHACNEL